MPFGPAEKQAVERFVDAWQRRDIDALAALLRADVILSMPPELVIVQRPGRRGRVLRHRARQGRLDLIAVGLFFFGETT